jgi:hypothetical protein
MSKRVPYTELANWNPELWMDEVRNTADHNTLMVAALFSIRDELRRLNRVLQCPNFIAVPSKLDAIAKNTRKRRKPRVVGKPKLRVVLRRVEARGELTRCFAPKWGGDSKPAVLPVTVSEPQS